MKSFTARDTGVVTMAWSAAQDRQGTLYFGCDTLVSFDGDRWRPEQMDPTYLVRGLDIGPNNRIWVAGVNQIGWFDRGKRLAYHSLVAELPRTRATWATSGGCTHRATKKPCSSPGSGC